MGTPATPAPLSESAVVTRLRAAGCVFAEDEARLLMSTARTPGELSAMVDRRAAGLPLEHVLGWAEFCGLRIAVDPGVFVPRRRTEFLVRQAIAIAPACPVIVDLCCGTGAVGAALAAALDGAELHATDIDPAAVRCARRHVAPAHPGRQRAVRAGRRGRATAARGPAARAAGRARRRRRRAGRPAARDRRGPAVAGRRRHAADRDQRAPGTSSMRYGPAWWPGPARGPVGRVRRHGHRGHQAGWIAGLTARAAVNRSRRGASRR